MWCDRFVPVMHLKHLKCWKRENVSKTVMCPGMIITYNIIVFVCIVFMHRLWFILSKQKTRDKFDKNAIKLFSFLECSFFTWFNMHFERQLFVHCTIYSRYFLYIASFVHTWATWLLEALKKKSSSFKTWMTCVEWYISTNIK